jgi:hypothetical protein
VELGGFIKFNDQKTRAIKMIIQVDKNNTNLKKYKSEELIEPGHYILFDKNPVFQEDYKKYLPIISASAGNRFMRLAPAERWVFDFLQIEMPDYLKPKYSVSLDIDNFRNTLDEYSGTLNNWQKAKLMKVLEKIGQDGKYASGLIVGLGGGKTLYTLMLGALGNLLYVAPKHLHGEIKREIAKWRIAEEIENFSITISTPESAKKLIGKQFAVGIVDETLSVKNPKALRTKGTRELFKLIPVKIAMTATPISAKSAPDLRWLRVLDDYVSEEEKNWIWAFGINPRHEAVPGRESEDAPKPLVCDGYRVREVAEYCKDFIEIVDISDILSQIPEMREETVNINPPVCFTSILRGLLTERTVQKRRTQALTATSGFVYSDEQRTIWLEKRCPAKIDWIKDFIENNPEEPVVVFSPWKAELQRLELELRQYSPAIVHDKNSEKEINRYVNGETNLLIVSASITEGMNLQRGRIIIATGWSTNPIKRTQAIGRVYRQGQTRGVVVYNLVCSNTLDGKALELIRKHEAEAKLLIQAQMDLDDEKLASLMDEAEQKINRALDEELELLLSGGGKKRPQVDSDKPDKSDKPRKSKSKSKVKTEMDPNDFFDDDLFPKSLNRRVEDYNLLFLDVETSGLKGKLNLVQYNYVQLNCKPRAEDTVIIRPYKDSDKMKNLLTLIDDPKTLIPGFNIGFDLGHLERFYNLGRPFKCQVLDLWLHAIKSPPLCFYPLLGKHVTALNRIPKKYSEPLATYISKEILSLSPGIARVRVKHEADENKDLESLVFSLSIPQKLKTLAKLFLPRERQGEIQALGEIFKLADFKENMRIPLILEEEREQYEALWRENEAILDNADADIYKYAALDIELLWLLKDWLNEQRAKYGWEPIKIESFDVCTHIIAYTRFFGFSFDKEKSIEVYNSLVQENQAIAAKYPGINLASWQQRKSLIKKELTIDLDVNLETDETRDSESEREYFNIDSTDVKKLKLLLTSGFLTEKGIEIVKDLLKYNPNRQKIKQLEVFVNSPENRVYPNLHPIGTNTGRMSGRDGINFQGVSKQDALRSLVNTSMGGDFDSLEITIAATFFKDANLLKILASGGDLHTMTASLIFQRFKSNNLPFQDFDLSDKDITYEYLMQLKENPGLDVDYSKIFKTARGMAKGVNFAILYFATSYAISGALEVDEESAQKWMTEHFFAEFPSLLKTRQEFEQKFCTADFEGWSKSSISRMQDEVKDIFGQPRFICLEKALACILWERCDEIASCAQNDPERVLRNKLKGEQTCYQAIRSACLGAASQIQKSVYRQLGNYPIQSSGAELTKRLMVAIWQQFHVAMMNIHDEIITPDYEEIWGVSDKVNKKAISEHVQIFIKKAQEKIPYLSMDFHAIENWSQK